MHKLTTVFVLCLLTILSLMVQGTEDISKSMDDTYVLEKYVVTEQPTGYNHYSKENDSFPIFKGSMRIRLNHVRPIENISITKDHPEVIQIGMRENFQNYPQIVLTPRDLSFTKSDSESYLGELVTISIFNPPECNITSAIIKIIRPSIDWEVIPDLNHSKIDYVSSEDAFWLQNFNESKTLHEWFYIKPGPEVVPEIYCLKVISTISYEAKDAASILRDNNKIISKEIKYNIVNLTVTGKPWRYQMKDNTWVFAFISAIGVTITVIFGPGIGKKLIDLIRHR
jgi:hypothetical protein